MKIGNGIQIHIVGLKKTGKTTLAEFLIKSLIEKGYRVGGFKHSIHVHPLDKPNTDTDRARQAGANPTVFYTPEGISAVYSGTAEQYQQVFDVLYKDCDYIIVESFRESEEPKLVIENSNLDLSKIKNIAAIINDEGKHDQYSAFKHNDKKLVDFIISKFPVKI